MRASLSCWLRDVTRDGVEELIARVRKIAEGVALATEVESTITIQAGSYEMLSSRAGARLLHSNLERLGPVPFTEEDQVFARTMQKNAGVEAAGMDGSVQVFEENPPVPEGGSTDVADVSWNVPTIHLSVTTAPVGVPWHSWAVVSSSGSAVGRRGMMYAGRALAATMVDLFAEPRNLEAMRKEFREKTGGRKYRAMIPDGPPPVPIN